jgi:hypothetical protein
MRIQEVEISSAKFLVGKKNFKGFTYTTDYPEFSTTVPLEDLKRIGDEFGSLSVVDRNRNLFSYPSFIPFLLKYILFYPLVFI